MNRATGRPTLSVIAAEAGVSLATVSKVINGRSDVAASTRQRVERLLLERRYVPVGARRATSTGLIDVIFTALDSPWAVEILRGVTEAMGERGGSAVVSTMPDEDDGTWPHRLIVAGRAGFIVVTSDLTDRQRIELERSRLPIVVVDPAGAPPPDLASVGATNWAGGMAATEHLIGLGHRRIGAIGGRPGMLCSRARLDGYRAALDQHGLPADADLIRDGAFSHDAGYLAAISLLDLPDPPTAIFAGSDQQAFGVLEAARVRGLRVPDDLSVVGFDDLPVARWASPPLTTIRQPLAEMGRMAAHIVMQQVLGGHPSATRVQLSTELVVRESTAPPPRG